jgi:hypothetical protein
MKDLNGRYVCRNFVAAIKALFGKSLVILSFFLNIRTNGQFAKPHPLRHFMSGFP